MKSSNNLKIIGGFRFLNATIVYTCIHLFLHENLFIQLLTWGLIIIGIKIGFDFYLTFHARKHQLGNVLGKVYEDVWLTKTYYWLLFVQLSISIICVLLIYYSNINISSGISFIFSFFIVSTINFYLLPEIEITVTEKGIIRWSNLGDFIPFSEISDMEMTSKGSCQLRLKNGQNITVSTTYHRKQKVIESLQSNWIMQAQK